MDNKKPTLKDVARVSGYSLASVHRALCNKDGVSKSVQEEILEIARSMGYTTNYLASTLKRKQMNIALVLPEAEVNGRRYFSYMWNGVREMGREVAGFNMDLREHTYDCGDHEALSERNLIEELYREQGEELDGLVYAPSKNTPELSGVINRFAARGTQVALIDNDFPDSGRLCCISPNDVFTGRMAAECLTGFLHRPGAVAVAAGDRDSLSHSLNLRGFQEYIAENSLPFEVLPVEDQGEEEVYLHMLRVLREREDVVGLYSVRARYTQAIGRAAGESGRAGELCVLGSDLFPESAQMLRDGILKGIVYKNPYQKGYLGLKVLFESLIKGISPKKDTLMVPISIIFRNNLRFFEEFL